MTADAACWRGRDDFRATYADGLRRREYATFLPRHTASYRTMMTGSIMPLIKCTRCLRFHT